MSDSTGKTIGIIIIVLVIAIFLFRLTPFILAPMGIFPVNMSKIDIHTPHGIFDWTANWFSPVHFSLFSLTLFFIWIFVIIWVYRDAEKRGMSGILWALLVFIGNIIGLIIYLIVRSDKIAASGGSPNVYLCASCRKPIDPKYAYCPRCGASLKDDCPECGKPVEKEWKTCAHCGKKME